MDKSEEIKARAARYNRTEIVTDSLGRVIKVRLLKPSQRIMLDEMAPNLSGTDRVQSTDEKTGAVTEIEVPKMATLSFAACVVGIDEAVFAFPKNREALNAVIDILDEPGITAAAEGFIKLNTADRDAMQGSEAEHAKNSQPTPASSSSAG